MRPRLEQITLRGFKTIRELDGFAPGNLTVLIGPNGAGKSNFISFFRMLAKSLKEPGQLQYYIGREGGASAILHRGPGITREISAELVLTTDVGNDAYGFKLGHGNGDTLIYADEWFGGQRNVPGPQTFRLMLGSGHRESELLKYPKLGTFTAQAVVDGMSGIVVHQFHDTSPTARIRSKWDAADGRYLKEDGGNLGAFLANLQVANPAHYRRIIETVRLILPFFADFELADEFGKVLLQWREIGSDQVLNAGQASDGMLRAMALIALLQQPEANLPDVLILDEPELGLHPYAIEVIASLIRSASHHVQVIIATQSVSLIDQFNPSDIVVVDRHSGETSLRRLNESELSEWLREYSLSELWEKNVLGGRPSR